MSTSLIDKIKRIHIPTMEEILAPSIREEGVFFVFDDIRCIDAEGKVFERHDELWAIK